jgi:hypothetical protein
MSKQFAESRDMVSAYTREKFPASILFRGVDHPMLWGPNFSLLPPNAGWNNVGINERTIDYRDERGMPLRRTLMGQAGGTVLAVGKGMVNGQETEFPIYNDDFLDRLVNYSDYRERALVGMIEALEAAAKAGIRLNVPKYPRSAAAGFAGGERGGSEGGRQASKGAARRLRPFGRRKVQSQGFGRLIILPKCI